MPRGNATEDGIRLLEHDARQPQDRVFPRACERRHGVGMTEDWCGGLQDQEQNTTIPRGAGRWGREIYRRGTAARITGSPQFRDRMPMRRSLLLALIAISSSAGGQSASSLRLVPPPREGRPGRDPLLSGGINCIVPPASDAPFAPRDLQNALRGKGIPAGGSRPE